MKPNVMNSVVISILIIEAVLIGTLIGHSNGAPYGLLIGALAFAFPVILLNVIGAIMGRVGTFGKLCAAHPLDEAVFRDSEGVRVVSMAVGSQMMRLNNCVAMAADDSYLHARISMPLAISSPGASIPWEQIEVITKSGHLAEMRLFDGGKLWVPWKFAQAESALRDSMERSAD